MFKLWLWLLRLNVPKWGYVLRLYVAIICTVFVATKCGYVLRLHVVICCNVRNVCCD